jgi:hypothetical protein
LAVSVGWPAQWARHLGDTYWGPSSGDGAGSRLARSRRDRHDRNAHGDDREGGDPGEGNPAGHSALARTVVRGHPDLVVAATTLLAQAVKAETRTIPTIAAILDPIGAGLAASLV